MTRILIIEDEMHAARRLQRLLAELAPEAQLVEVLDSVEDAVEWLQAQPHPDLCFMDIQLADGLSFEIFRQTELRCPVIFTTAFDQYAVRAFRVNGLDYLLKPVEDEQLTEALARFKSRQSFSQQSGVRESGVRAEGQRDLPKGTPPTAREGNESEKKRDLEDRGELVPLPEVMAVLQAMQNRNRRYRERFLVKTGDQLRHIPVADAAWFKADSGYVDLALKNGNKVLLDKSLDQVLEDLDPEIFYKINRKMIVRLESVGKIHTYLNSRLKLELAPDPGEEVIVSRDRVKGFKAWLDR